MSDVLDRRALNRATLERQLLLRRSELPVLDAVKHLVGLQAQEPLNPYTALWSRLDGFRPEALARLLEERQVVRLAVMRSTVHLVTADDCLVLRPLMQPVLDAELARYRRPARRRRRGRARLRTGARGGAAAIRPRVAGCPGGAFSRARRGRPRLRRRNLLAFVQVPPRGVWGRTSQVASTTAEAWLGRPLARRPVLDEVVLRYLGAFGPATVADVAAWSRLTGLREVVERLRPKLRTFRDERGRELFDLPDAPRPDPETPAPVRFLPEYDNVLLSHADRSRFISGERRDVLGARARDRAARRLCLRGVATRAGGVAARQLPGARPEADTGRRRCRGPAVLAPRRCRRAGARRPSRPDRLRRRVGHG